MLMLSVYLSISIVSFSQNERQVPKHDIDSLRDYLKFSVDREHTQKIKAVRVVLSNDSIKLNDQFFDSIDLLSGRLRKIFSRIYSHEKTDSVIAVQIFFERNISRDLHMELHHEIELIFQESWSREAEKLYAKTYDRLTDSESEVVKGNIPFYLTEYELSLYERIVR